MADPVFGTAGPGDAGELADLCARCLGIGSDHFAARFRDDPVFLPGGWLTARAGGRIVATVHACGFDLVFGSARVPCGGIGNVSTDPGWRKRGLAHRLMDDAHALMLARGMPVSILTTEIQGFYRPLGYAVWPHVDCHLLKLRPPAGAGPGPRVRRIDFGRDRTALLAIRDRYASGFVGTIAATGDRWSRQPAWTALYPKEEPACALLVEDARGRPAAYLRATADPGHAWSKVLEFGAVPGAEEETKALARSYLREAFLRGVRGLQYPAPCRELGEGLAPFAEAQVDVVADYLMLRIADLSGFLRALEPELTARAGTVRGAVAIAYGEQAAALRLTHGRVEVTDQPPDPRAGSKTGSHGAVIENPAKLAKAPCVCSPFDTKLFISSSVS